MVVMDGHRHLILCNVTWRLGELDAFVASTSNAASRSSDSKADVVACTAALMPDISPSHN